MYNYNSTVTRERAECLLGFGTRGQVDDFESPHHSLRSRYLNRDAGHLPRLGQKGCYFMIESVVGDEEGPLVR